MPPSALARTWSASSVASDETSLSFDDNTIVPDTPSTGNTSDGGSSAKRTRKRFTNPQIIALEQVFHQSSHPTREQREAVAKETGLELRSVTIWFQNKRQTERKIALCYGPSFYKDQDIPQSPAPFPTTQTSAPSRAVPLSSNASYQRSIRHSIHAHRPQLSEHRRPSLDSVASRNERPQAPPKTPSRIRTYSTPSPHQSGATTSTAALWEHMPSSPLGPSSPERERVRDRELVDFGMTGGTKRTLEWACAAARISGRQDEDEDDTVVLSTSKADPRSQRASHTQSRPFGFIVADGHADMETLDFGGDTEDESEAHEAVTPSSSQSRVDMNARVKWAMGPGRKHDPRKERMAMTREMPMVRTSTHDEEMVNAALVLCGLGKR
ncbi:hypothetical protein EIP91_011844 [Steccherinum ochraceum]|uniref:Homeobox domain-containing protein n=1 Tax=Steccherinum ochraceum TaxID=92696 RepID=A0A4R0RHE4_9APHY|nr:hypothetical protein EIP91_011844 [Steccherinum ochraceum]